MFDFRRFSNFRYKYTILDNSVRFETLMLDTSVQNRKLVFFSAEDRCKTQSLSDKEARVQTPSVKILSMCEMKNVFWL